MLRKKTLALALLYTACTCGTVQAATAYFQTNLASDVPGLSPNLDGNLKNPWGMSFGLTTPFWVSNQGSNNATLYNGAGVPQSLVVSTAPGPTGQIFNTSSSFALPTGGKSLFIFATLSGVIDGWNGAQGTTAVPKFTATDGAGFTGLAIGSNASGDLLYASDFNNARIDVFDGNFAPTTVSGGFIDSSLPSGYSPYNIQAIGGLLYVEYAQVNPTTHRPVIAAGAGIVDTYDMNGNLQQHLVTSGGALNAPWGVTQAPAGFGSFGDDILVGNFGDGKINVYSPTTGALLGTISGQNGSPIANSGLWALNFRAPGSGFDTNTLFFNAGINGEADGLFGEIQMVPEPGTAVLVAFAAAGFLASTRLSKRRRAGVSA